MLFPFLLQFTKTYLIQSGLKINQIKLFILPNNMENGIKVRCCQKLGDLKVKWSVNFMKLFILQKSPLSVVLFTWLYVWSGKRETVARTYASPPQWDPAWSWWLYISWAAYYASQHPAMDRYISKIVLLPLFRENPHTTCMVSQAMDMVKLAVHHLNPHQVPIITADQPVYVAVNKSSDPG